MKSLKDIEKLIKSFQIKPESEMQSKQLKELLDMQKTSKQKSISDTNIWRVFMKSRITKFAAAAIIVIAAIISTYYFNVNVDGANTAYARMLENVRKAHSVRYKQTFVQSDWTNLVNTVMINGSGVSRTEIVGGTVLLFYPNRDFQMTLWPMQKRAFITRKQNSKYPQIDMLEYVLNIKRIASEYKGRQMINGQLADLYVGQWSSGETSVWVDPQTELPIYVEEKQYKNLNCSYPSLHLDVNDFGGNSGRCGSAGREPFISIKSDFQWNVELDESLFSEMPPADYNVTEHISNMSEPNETHVIEALRFWAEYHDGQLPPCIEILGDVNENRPMLIKKFNQDGDPEKEYEAAFEYGVLVLKGIDFAQNKRAQSNWFYNEGVVLDETDKPVCWWKLENGNGYRVIYGDLTIHDINDMPQN